MSARPRPARIETPSEKTQRLELELDKVERRESDLPEIGPDDVTEVVKLACARASRLAAEGHAETYRLSREITISARGFRAPASGHDDVVKLGTKGT